MPKELFFNIDKQKRALFLEAAIEEFTTKPYSEVSVNTIIKKADISRGSFYTYFDNLDELFNYIISEVKNERFAYAKKLIDDSNGDFFKFARLLFQYDFDSFKEKGRYSLFQNYIYFIQSKMHGSLQDTMIMDTIMKMTNQGKIFSELPQNNHSTCNPEDFSDLVEVVLLIMVNSFLKAENEGLTKEQAITLFNKRISYLEYGIKI